jgi:hypothetical protein
MHPVLHSNPELRVSTYTVVSKLGMVYRTLVVALLYSSATSATVLTPDNYDSLTSGQSVFIKFYAPWSVLQ